MNTHKTRFLFFSSSSSSSRSTFTPTKLMTKDFYAVIWNRMLNNKVEERTEDATAVDWQWCGKPRPVKQKNKKTKKNKKKRTKFWKWTEGNRKKKKEFPMRRY
jgi:hypothetical protein